MGKLAIVFKEKWNRFSHYLRNILQNDIACLCITPSLCRRLIYNWLGHNVKGVVFPHCFLGVAKGKLTLAKGCIIGAGTLVTEDTEENGIYVGIPARLIRKL